ncbi:hypothetical protein Sango_1390400 [Sesamum angolense]|uniref:Single-stranded DNA binding protein Ssb-like OB fold domain-containing protein n=1 Tax=Sesamum angolense TaxID=2727404 RepID=A0AAE1WTS9_9LAMI|nr:hypothetical protein Sango_1390400 [Sesamum angolense]
MATKSPTTTTQQQGATAGNKPGLRKPVFVKVDALKPGTNGHTLIVKVVNSNTVLNKKPRNPTFRGPQNQNTRIAECLIGDETGTILFTARNEQVMLIAWSLMPYSCGSETIAIEKLTHPPPIGVAWNAVCGLSMCLVLPVIVIYLASTSVMVLNVLYASPLWYPLAYLLMKSFTFDAVELMKPGNTVILRNAKIDMFKGSMRLAVDKWGRIEVAEPAKFVVKEDNNLSLVEYELVNVVEES